MCDRKTISLEQFKDAESELLRLGDEYSGEDIRQLILNSQDNVKYTNKDIIDLAYEYCLINNSKVEYFTVYKDVNIGQRLLYAYETEKEYAKSLVSLKCRAYKETYIRLVMDEYPKQRARKLTVLLLYIKITKTLPGKKTIFYGIDINAFYNSILFGFAHYKYFEILIKNKVVVNYYNSSHVRDKSDKIVNTLIEYIVEHNKFPSGSEKYKNKEVGRILFKIKKSNNLRRLKSISSKHTLLKELLKDKIIQTEELYKQHGLKIDR